MAGGPADMSARNTTRVVAGIAIATLVVLLPALRAGFVWDDALLIRDNPWIRGPGALARAFTHGFWDLGGAQVDRLAGNYYRPLVTGLFVLIRGVAGARPWPFHAAVVALHLVAVALAGRFFRRMLGDDALAVGAATGLFALHATRAESVVWVVGVTDVLMTVPALLALTRAARARDVAPRPQPIDAALAAVYTLCALGAKETAAVLPIALAIVAVARHPRGEPRRAALLAHAAPSALAVAAYAALRMLYMPLGPALFSPPLGAHVLLVLETLGRYAGLVVWPFPLTSMRAALRLDPAGALRVSLAWVAAGVAVLGLAAALVARRQRSVPPAALAGLLLAGVFLAPVMNVRWTGLVYLVADRMLYLPMVGLGLAAGALAARAPSSAHRAVVLALGGLALAHGAAIVARGLEYRDEWNFWTAELAIHADAPVALSGLAAAEVGRARPGRAFLLLERALAAMPSYATDERVASDAYLAFDVALRVVPDSDRASLESALEFDRVLRHGPGRVAHASLLGHAFALDRARIAAWLAREDAHVAMSEAVLLSRLGRTDEARVAADAAVARCTLRCVDANLNAALIHARACDWDTADALAARARALDPTLAAARTLQEQLVTARAHARDRDRADAPAERALIDAELDVFFAAPEAARARLAAVPVSPRRELLRARIALAEYHFAEAAEIVEPLERGAPPQAAPAFRALREYEAAQRRRAEGLEAELAARP